MKINANRQFCYRICHIGNLRHLLEVGLCTKYHPSADSNFINIGNQQIIDTRDKTPVRIDGYGRIGDYVPFYFTPRSIMLFNIVTGYWAPKVPQIARDQIIVTQCKIDQLVNVNRYFFTDGQANDKYTEHFMNLDDLDKIDWEIIQNSSFSKSDGDYDRARRYQAEFLVHNHVPISAVEPIVVYNENARDRTAALVDQYGLDLTVKVYQRYFF